MQKSGKWLLFGLLNGVLYSSNVQATDYLPTIDVEGVRTQTTDVLGASVLNRENIELRQADNVGALLDSLPGVNMGGTARPGGQTLNIWGLGDQEDIAITLDGAPKNFEKYQQGTVFVEPELLKRVAVEKGSFDVSRAGSFGGAVRMETKDATDFMGNRFGFGGFVKGAYHSNDHQQQYTGAFMWRGKRADALLAVSYRRGKDSRLVNGDPLRFSENSRESVLFKGNVDLTENSVVTLSFVESRHEGWEPWAAKSGNALTPPSERDIRRYGYDEAWRRKLVYREQKDSSFSIKHRWTPENPLIDLTTSIYYSKTSQHDKRPASASRFLSGSMGNESWTEYTNKGIDIRNVSQLRTGGLSHQLMLGIQADYLDRNVRMLDLGKAANRAANKRYNYGYYNPPYAPSGKTRHIGFYITDDITYGQVTISPGLRYDEYKNYGQANLASLYNSTDPQVGHDYRSKKYTGWSPFLGIRWDINPNLSLFANVSRTWRAPVVDEQYTVQFPSSRASASSRDLVSEKMFAQRYGVTAKFSDLFTSSDKLELRALAFHLRGKDEIFLRRGLFCEAAATVEDNRACGDRKFSNYRNIPGYKIYGVELEAYYQSPRILASLAYFASRGTWLTSPRNPYQTINGWLTSTPPQKLVATLAYKFNSIGLLLGWKGEFVKAQRHSIADKDPMATYFALPKTAGYSVHSLYAVYQPTYVKNLTLQLTVDNLFNKDYLPYLSERVPQVGRNVKVSASYQF